MENIWKHHINKDNYYCYFPGISRKAFLACVADIDVYIFTSIDNSIICSTYSLSLESFGELQSLPLPTQISIAQNMEEYVDMEISTWPNSSQFRKSQCQLANSLKI